MIRVWIIAGLTFREAARKRILWMALAGGFAFLILFSVGLHFQLVGLDDRHATPTVREQVVSGVLMVGLYAIDLLAVVMTVLTSVDTLSGEIASGTIQAVATKPVRRSEILLGKWFVFAAMFTLYLALMVGGTDLLTFSMTGVGARHLAQGFSLIWLETLVLLAITFFFGTLLSTLTNGVLVLGLHGLAFIGGWIEQAGALTKTPQAVNVGVVASILMPSESLWRRAVYEMQSPLTTALGLSPFSGASVPSAAMIGYAVLYTIAFLGLAVWRLETRDL